MSTQATSSGAEPAGRREAGEAIRLEAATAKRGGRPVWSGVDLSVGQGEFVAVLGPNGSGKSTLLHVLLGLLPLSDGQRHGPLRPARFRQLPDRLPAAAAQLRCRHAGSRPRPGAPGPRRDALGLPAADALSARGRAAASRVEEAIELVGASAYASRPIGALSGGEQQRLLIAQALVRRPRILLLDEPLDSLDLSNQGAVAALVQRICKEEGVTVLLVAHDVNPILPYLDRVIYFAAGGGVEGTPREVITGPTLSRLYGVPVEVLETSDGRLVVVGTPEPPAHHHPRHDHGH